MECIETLVKGALLHDIGKVVYRSGEVSEDAATAGATFLRSYTQQEEIVRCAGFHHKNKLELANFSNDSFAYLVYEAMLLATANDYEKLEEGNPTYKQYFDSTMPLTSVFYTFGGAETTEPQCYSWNTKDDNYSMEGMVYPTDENCSVPKEVYQELYRRLKQSFEAKSVDAMTVNELLQTYEDSTCFVPATVGRQKRSDTSLYMHSKLTAAIANSLKLYFDEQGIHDYKRYCFINAEEIRDKETFMMVSADISGIQDFIYTVPSKGALKSLRGRSVYLEILLESVIDCLLGALKLTRCNVIYSGGGHFYILAPATEQAKKVVSDMQASVNQWLLEHVGTKLYIAMGTATCSRQDLLDKKKQHKLFADASRNADNGKMMRYDEKTLQKLFNPNSSLNTVGVGDKECSICHTSAVELLRYGESDTNESDTYESDTYACPMCDSLFRLGEGLVQNNDIILGIAPYDETLAMMYSIPIYDTNRAYLYLVPQDEFEKLSAKIEWKRLYLINKRATGPSVANRLWIADYVARKENTTVYEFSELVKLCGEESVGVERLGVLRADVDNLGAAFINGFINDSKNKPYKYNTFSRYADLSRALSMFFKVGVNQIIADDTSEESFCLWENSIRETGHIHVIYSGGDDVFLVGPWDELLEAGIEIRERLRVFSDKKVTISAGLGMFSPTFPVIKMAEITGELESTAKDMSMKDSIALFGFTTMNVGSAPECQHVYSWDDLIQSVIQDKFKFFQKVFAISRQGIVEDAERLPFNRTAIYRMMDLLEGIVKADSDKIYNARLLYTLSRMEPIDGSEKQKELYKEFVQSMYKWIRNKKNAKETLTAFHLLVYSLREKL